MSDIDRMIRDAEWRGQVVTTLEMLRDNIKDLEKADEKSIQERSEIFLRITKIESIFADMGKKLDEASSDAKPMSTREKVALYVALISGIFGVIGVVLTQIL